MKIGSLFATGLAADRVSSRQWSQAAAITASRPNVVDGLGPEAGKPLAHARP
jgi:hypothetical protein